MFKLEVRSLQLILQRIGAYRGSIDGDAGRMTWAAIHSIIENVPEAATWQTSRKMVAALQVALRDLGHEPGKIDGWFGNETFEALTEALTADGYRWIRPDGPSPAAPVAMKEWPTQAKVRDYYGDAGGASCTAGVVNLPFKFPLSWNTEEFVTNPRCHKLVASALTSIFVEAAQHYGETTFRRLRLDMWGGCYNFRNMRGGTSLSMHSWGIAVDLDPERNQLRWGADRAAFAGGAYDPFWKIVEAKGAISLGRARNFDFMHFQFARL